MPGTPSLPDRNKSSSALGMTFLITHFKDITLVSSPTDKQVKSQCPEMISNKIEKTFNKTYTGLKSFFRDSKSVFLKILAARVWNPPARQQCQISPIQAVSATLPSLWIPSPYS